MKFTKSQNEKIRKSVWNYFQPIHEHLGRENSSSIHEIANTIQREVNLILNKEGKELFIAKVGGVIFNELMKPKKRHCNSLYIKGLGWFVDRKRTGHYFIIQTKAEADAITEHCQKLIISRQKNMHIRKIQYNQHLALPNQTNLQIPLSEPK